LPRLPCDEHGRRCGRDGSGGCRYATPLTLASTTIQVGTGTAVDIAGTYATSQDLVDAINSQVTGAYASIDFHEPPGDLVRRSDHVGGAGAAIGAATAALLGSLNTQNVNSVNGANSTIQSVDAALTSVSTLRSTLGAIQNRFQSTINSLQGRAPKTCPLRAAAFSTRTSRLKRRH
jgi:flagellin